MNEQERCATCRWWGHVKFSYPEEGWGECALRATDEYGESSQPTLAYVWESDQSAAGLITRPDFGCVQWAAREA